MALGYLRSYFVLCASSQVKSLQRAFTFAVTVGIVYGGFQSVRYGFERGTSFAAYEIAILNVSFKIELGETAPLLACAYMLSFSNYSNLLRRSSSHKDRGPQVLYYSESLGESSDGGFISSILICENLRVPLDQYGCHYNCRQALSCDP